MQECNEYTIGLCTKDAFKLKDITKECKLVHSNTSRHKFETADILMGFESEVLKTYKQIIEECDNKIKIIKQLIENTKTKQEEKLEEVFKICANSFAKNPNRTLHKIMQELYGELLKQNKKIKICSFCGAFCKDKRDCEHFTHETYIKLREVYEKLRMKIENITNKNEGYK